MSIALIIGVLLISGVVAPVIANVSSDSGEDSGSGGDTLETIKYGHWKMAESGEWDLYTSDIGGNAIGLYYDDPSDSDPFFTIEIMNGETDDILPIMIGEDFFVYIYYPHAMDEWHPDFWIIGDNGEDLSARSDEIHVNGNTISFTSNVEYDSPIYTMDGLIAHISDEGDYTAYPNGDATSVTYAVMNGWFSEYDESTGVSYDAHVYATMDGSGLMWSDGFAYVYHGDVYTTNNWTSASATATYIKSDGKYMGMSINGTYDSNLDLSEDVPFGAGYNEGESGFKEYIAFAVGPIGNGGGSGLSPTLTTILSVIPLILTVGLVIGAIGFLRMKN